MMEKIKKLLLGSFEDIRMGMILLVTNYPKEEIRKLGGRRELATSGGCNKVYYKDFCVYVDSGGYVSYADREENKDCYINIRTYKNRLEFYVLDDIKNHIDD